MCSILHGRGAPTPRPLINAPSKEVAMTSSNVSHKTCRKCGDTKPVSKFYKHKDYPDGYKAQCRDCINARRKLHESKPEVRAGINEQNMEYHWRNREKRCAAMAKRQKENWDKVLEWRAENADKIAESQRRWADNHPEKKAASDRRWRESNRGKVRASNAKREKAIRLQTPPYADLQAIEKFYIYSAQITAETGIQHHVDHIIPLQGKLVSGLHVEGNLRVIPAKVNIQKSNSYRL